MTQTSDVSTTFSTFDYNLFHFFGSNRPPLHWRKIMQSIEKQDLTKFVPILTVVVNGKYYIVDGQNRFLACKALNKPIYYLILPESCDEETMFILNIDRKNWTLENYLNFWSAQDKPHYETVQMILTECDNLTVSQVLSIWQISDGKKGFKCGKYSLPQKGIAKIRIVSNILRVIKASVDKKEFGKNPSGSLVKAVSSILTCGANPNILINRIKSYPGLFKKQPSQTYYFEMFEHIYNYRTRNKIAFKYKVGKKNIETYY